MRLETPDAIARRLRARMLRDYAIFAAMAVAFFAGYWFVGGGQ